MNLRPHNQVFLLPVDSTWITCGRKRNRPRLSTPNCDTNLLWFSGTSYFQKSVVPDSRAPQRVVPRSAASAHLGLLRNAQPRAPNIGPSESESAFEHIPQVTGRHAGTVERASAHESRDLGKSPDRPRRGSVTPRKSLGGGVLSPFVNRGCLDQRVATVLGAGGGNRGLGSWTPSSINILTK